MSDVVSIPDEIVVQRMVALFDYDPWESSPNVNSEVSNTLTRSSNSLSFIVSNLKVFLLAG